MVVWPLLGPGSGDVSAVADTPGPIEVSLIVCTRNRAPQLRRMLARASELRADRWELIIVDNGSTDGTAAVLEEFRDRIPVPLTVTREGRPGLGRARNAGLRVARGELVAFTDDDCYPSEDYLQRIRECFAAGSPDLAYVGGRILLFDPTDYPITIQEETLVIPVPPAAFVRAGLIQGANMGFRRAALEAVGGFDERMGSGTPFACEDVEMLARLSASGWTGCYDPRPLVYHHHGRKTAGEAQAHMRQYDFGRGAYYAKCLFNPSLRAIYAKTWYWSMGAMPWRKSFREIRGAVRFLGVMVVSRARAVP
jgi:hypothetical protein